MWLFSHPNIPDLTRRVLVACRICLIVLNTRSCLLFLRFSSFVILVLSRDYGFCHCYVVCVQILATVLLKLCLKYIELDYILVHCKKTNKTKEVHGPNWRKGVEIKCSTCDINPSIQIRCTVITQSSKQVDKTRWHPNVLWKLQVYVSHMP